MKIAIIREGKIPIDRRVPLVPEQCCALQKAYPGLQFIIQSSAIRSIPDEAYLAQGLEVSPKVEDCDVFLGVKEVPKDQLIPHKTYFFFSHTIKQQAYNRELLQTILRKGIRLIDYECLTQRDGGRVVAFGRFAGVVGAYNGLIAFGKKYRLFDLKPAHACEDMQEMQRELDQIQMPPIKILITGSGRVGNGAREVMEMLRLPSVSPRDILQKKFSGPVFTQLSSQDYYRSLGRGTWKSSEFYSHPERFEADFQKYTREVDLFISGHFWNPKAAPLFSRSDVLRPDFKMKVIADVTCDIQGGIPTTLRETTVEDPVYDIDPRTFEEKPAYSDPSFVSVMAVDNLPSELPKDASRSFGEQLSTHVFPALMKHDPEGLLRRATIAQKGELLPLYSYLESFVNG